MHIVSGNSISTNLVDVLVVQILYQGLLRQKIKLKKKYLRDKSAVYKSCFLYSLQFLSDTSYEGRGIRIISTICEGFVVCSVCPAAL